MKRTRPKIFTPYPTTARGLRCCFEFKTWRSMAVERKCSFMCFLRWPTSATAKLTLPRQNLLFHGKTYFSTAKLTFLRQNLLSHGKTYFLTAKLTFPRQNLLFHGKTYFLTAKLTFPFLASSLSLPMLSRVGDPGILSRAIWRMAKKIMCE